MDLKDYPIDENTHPYLLAMAMSYRPHTPIPSRQEMMKARYEIDGHLTLKALKEDVWLGLLF